MFIFLANGDTKGAAGMSRSVPSSPGDRKQGSIPVVGSAEDLVGRVNIFLQCDGHSSEIIGLCLMKCSNELNFKICHSFGIQKTTWVFVFTVQN